MPTTLPARSTQGGLTGRHVLLGMLGFFAVVFAVNGILLVAALSTHSGLVAHEPYRKGLHYNARVEAGERQKRLGWTESVRLDANGQLAVQLLDANGSPIRLLDLSAVVGRPSTTQQDRRALLQEYAPGHYSGSAGPIESGAWIVALEARLNAGPAEAGVAQEPIYRIKRRLWVKP